ncbi:MAG: glycosyltransferase [Wolinella sp.]
MHDYLIITHIPAFYKVNLYNELAKKLKIFVIFIASNTSQKRSSDFSGINNAAFEYTICHHGDFQHRDRCRNLFAILNFLRTISYKRLLVSGWDLPEFWFASFLSPRHKNALALESSINESHTNGLKGAIKRLFISRISRVFASGEAHGRLARALGFKGDIVITKGVGIINKPHFEPIKRAYARRFLFIGRLSPEKNIKFLVELFNELPEFRLEIVGRGELEEELKMLAHSNIHFVGAVENRVLADYFLQNDLLLLPSQSETWGLVIEEALYFGMPVILSAKCGACELIHDHINGIIIRELASLREAILSLSGTSYEKLIEGVARYSIEQKDLAQVGSYEL